jgi:hypothetical protein
VLGGHQYCPAPLPAQADALQEAQDYEKERGCDAYGRVAGQEPDEESGEAHNQEREDQHRLSSEPVAEVPEDRTAQRPRQEGYPERGEGGQGAGDRGQLREEHSPEDQGRRGPVDIEVVELDGGADEAGEGYLLHRCFLPDVHTGKLLHAYLPRYFGGSSPRMSLRAPNRTTTACSRS